jgi:hypothetical protein
MEQAEDRVHRIGQTHNVDLHYLVARGSIDEMMFAILNKKKRETSLILNGQTADLKCADSGSQRKKRPGGDGAGGSKAPASNEATTEKKRPRLSGNRTLDELFPKAGEQASNKVESENVRDSADLDLTWSQ